MNFTHMPELDWPWAYPAFWGLSLLISVGMLVGFRRRGWF
jgi:magnesium transporter